MPVLRVLAFAVCLSLVGCGSKSDKTEAPNDGKPGAPASKFTIENVSRIQRGMSTYNDVVQIFGTKGESTNEEKPGLMMGSKSVWKEGDKKVYVSFGQDGKANGVAWEGFGGK